MEESTIINQEMNAGDLDVIGTTEPTPEKKKRIGADDFRKNATHEDLEKLAAFLADKKNKTEAMKNSPYDFSYSFAAGLLREKGIWEPTKEASEQNEEPNTEGKIFTLDALPKGAHYSTRSVQIEDGINERLKAFLEDKEGYTSRAVISQIISAGLSVYGF